MWQNLGRECVSTKALLTILEAIADGNPWSKAPDVLSEDTCQHLSIPIGVRRPPCQSLRRRTGSVCASIATPPPLSHPPASIAVHVCRTPGGAGKHHKGTNADADMPLDM